MPQFADWKRQFAAWTDATQMRQSQVHQVVSDLAVRGREATDQVSVRAVDVAERARRRGGRLPRAMFAELQRRVNVLDLATTSDVAVQGRLGRSRVSVVLKEFLESQRRHDEELRETLRCELRQELRSLGLATKDEVVALGRQFDSDLHASIAKSSPGNATA